MKSCLQTNKQTDKQIQGVHVHVYTHTVYNCTCTIYGTPGLIIMKKYLISKSTCMHRTSTTVTLQNTICSTHHTLTCFIQETTQVSMTCTAITLLSWLPERTQSERMSREGMAKMSSPHSCPSVTYSVQNTYSTNYKLTEMVDRDKKPIVIVTTMTMCSPEHKHTCTYTCS